MKGDFSRLTFDATKHFSRVMMQQGRVQLDADWNEQTAIFLHYIQSLAMDLIGEHGGPKDNCGYEIKKIDNIESDFQICKGRYYIDGILVELEPSLISTEVVGQGNNQLMVSTLSINNTPLKVGQYLEVRVKDNDFKLVKITAIDKEKRLLTVEPSLAEAGAAYVRRGVTYANQEDYPFPPTLEQNKTYLVYLDIWEQHITFIEDDSIREMALGGPDTATRAKLVSHVKITDKQPDRNRELKDIKPIPADWRAWVYENGKNRWSDWKKQWQPENRGLLKAQAKQDPRKDSDPCNISPEANYRGAENQLYRIEIHQGGLARDRNENASGSSASFKWSRDNGSVVTSIINLNEQELTVENSRGLSAGKWLELTNDNQELRGKSGLLFKIKNIDCETVTLEATANINAPGDVPQGEKWPTKARLWESNALQIQKTETLVSKASPWIPLADGIEVQFQQSTSAQEHYYRTGDYWLIPVRVATGDVEWPGPVGNPEALPPHGVEHHYVPLAIIVNNNGANTIFDLRKHFDTLAKDI